MAGLVELNKLYKERGEHYINKLLNSYVIVSENLDGSKISIQKYDDEVVIFKRDDENPINIIDRTIMVYYEKAISYFNTLSTSIKNEIPTNWRFCFQYFIDTKPVNIEYDKLPKNNLVLTHINVKSDNDRTLKVIDDSIMLNKWADILQVERPPIYFSGFLTDEQKGKIFDYLNLTDSDIKEFNSYITFSTYIIQILNPNIKTTILNTENKCIDSLIFKFIDKAGEESISAKLVDPYIAELKRDRNNNRNRVTSDIYSIVLLDIIEFVELNKGVINPKILSIKPDERYLELISDMFNKYIEANGHKYNELDFDNPEYTKSANFDLNTIFIKNEKTLEYINSSKAYKDLFKIFLNSLRQERTKTTNILNKQVLNMINEIILRIKAITETPVEDKFITFTEYMQLKESNNRIYESELDEEDLYELNSGDVVTFTAGPISAANSPIPNDSGPPSGPSRIYEQKNYANFLVGRFQPFTNGHIKAIQELNEQNEFPVIVINIKSGNEPVNEKSPYDEAIQKEMFEEIQKKYSYIKEMITIYGKASIMQIFDSIREKCYEPALWGVGSDRVNTFGYQAERYKDLVNPSIYFKVHEITRKNGDVSATMARNAIKSNDRVTFENLVPTCIHFFYDKLKDIIVAESIIANKGPLFNIIKDTIIGTADGRGNTKLENL